MISFGIPAREAFFLEPGVRFLNHGSFGAVPRPSPRRPRAGGDGWTRKRLMSVLFAEHRVVVAVNAVSGALWARLSAQIYNIAEDYELLARLA